MRQEEEVAVNNIIRAERNNIEMWKDVVSSTDLKNPRNHQLLDKLIQHTTVPMIITNKELDIVISNLPDDSISDKQKLMDEIMKMSADKEFPPISITSSHGLGNRDVYTIYYQNPTYSSLVESERYSTLVDNDNRHLLELFPYVQLIIVIVFAIIVVIAFTSTKQNEQNRVWVGLAKETAHQLGTPTSSLLGWVEYLRSQPVDPMVVDEMSKDLSHLMKIVDRFSKIGSETQLTNSNVNVVVGDTVMYFRRRIPRNVTLNYEGLAKAPINAPLNAALFEWVIENLLKNALDALQGSGTIDVEVGESAKSVYVEVRDTGKGIPKASWERIFEPGYTTKTRGWGLGLSLSRRIIEEYHKGEIGVVASEMGRGTTIRVTLKRLDDE
jgi:signal transduction histidine kinase